MEDLSQALSGTRKRWDFETALRMYLQMVPVKRLFQEVKAAGIDNDWISSDFQDQVVEELLENAQCQRYPPSPLYTARFLRQFDDELQLQQEYEVSDGLMSWIYKLAKNMNEPADIVDTCYVTYVLPEDVVITCRTARRHNEVGLRVWEAGLHLAQYAISESSIFEEKNVVELGAGIGLTSFCVAAFCQPNSVVATDYADDVLDNMKFNAELFEKQKKTGTISVQIEKLDWTAPDVGFTENCAPDIILAADVAYDPKYLPDLVNTIKTLSAVHQVADTRTSKKIRHSVKTIMSSTIRNKSTFETLLQLLKESGADIKDVTKTNDSENEPVNFFSEPVGEIRTVVVTFTNL